MHEGGVIVIDKVPLDRRAPAPNGAVGFETSTARWLVAIDGLWEPLNR